MIDHIDELAELYALGSLDDLERVRVERHIATCRDCALRLQQAEQTITDLALAQPLHEPPDSLYARLQASVAATQQTTRRRSVWRPTFAAIAAAVILAFVPTWVAVDRTRDAVQAMWADEHALARIASTSFNHVEFMSPDHRPMGAKVLYGPHGDWYYVVVMRPKPNMHVAYVHGGHMELLGTVATHGESGTLYLPVNHKMDELALVEGNTVVGNAYLVY
jgi:hypothetical protein